MKKYILGLIFIISCTGTNDTSGALDTLQTSTEDSLTTTSTSSYEEKEICLQYTKEMIDVNKNFQLMSKSMENLSDIWFESEQNSIDSDKFRDSLIDLNNDVLIPLNSQIENLVPDSRNFVIQTKWLELIIRTNKTMDLFLGGLENLDYFSISQGRTFIKVINKDFDSIPSLNNCE
tara:strand:+ start:100 stop:627 length:528 start_codon:yes stop_codon:yes gene_type:complete